MSHTWIHKGSLLQDGVRRRPEYSIFTWRFCDFYYRYRGTVKSKLRVRIRVILRARSPRKWSSIRERSLSSLFLEGNAPLDRATLFVAGSLPVRGETVASWIEQPRIVIGTLHAGEEAKGFSRKLPGGQGAGVWQGAVGLSLLVAGLLPVLEVPQGWQFSGRLHPLDHLQVE